MEERLTENEWITKVYKRKVERLSLSISYLERDGDKFHIIPDLKRELAVIKHNFSDFKRSEKSETY